MERIPWLHREDFSIPPPDADSVSISFPPSFVSTEFHSSRHLSGQKEEEEEEEEEEKKMAGSCDAAGRWKQKKKKGENRERRKKKGKKRINGVAIIITVGG